MRKDNIKLGRDFFESQEWEQDRTFSHAEALLDLLWIAEIQSKNQIIPGKKEVHTSMRLLSKQWNWSDRKVKRFLDMEARLERISIQKNGMILLLNILF